MASDGNPGAISGASAVLSSQAAEPTKFQAGSGKTLPQSGNGAAAAAAAGLRGAANAPQSSNTAPPSHSAAVTSGPGTLKSGAANPNPAKSPAASTSDPRALASQLNKVLNNSGRADQFRVDPTSDKFIQQVNPASGEVIAEYSVDEFPALARSIGASGLLIDETA
jgi:hypothetical protein